MTDRSKLIFVNADGNFEEAAAADSLKFASYKTANYELTDALLGDVTNKMVKADGSRAFAADQSMGGFKLTNVADGSSSGDAVNYGQLAAVIASQANLEFYNSVKSRATTPPGSPASGDRYLVIATATGAFAGKENQIAEWNGSGWSFTVPTTGGFLSVDDDSDKLMYFNGTAWVAKYFEATTASLGVKKVGMDVRADLLASGGLKLVGDSLKVAPVDFAGAGLADDGSDKMAIDFYNPATPAHLTSGARAAKVTDLYANGAGQGAKVIGVDPANLQGYSAATTVQAALEDLAKAISEDDSVVYTAATGGVTKGDLLSISAANTVQKLDVSQPAQAVGVAHATAAGSAAVRALQDGEVVAGVLTALSAAAGDRIYWSGTALTKTAPTASGSHVHQVGIAKNANDLQVKMAFIKKNA